MVCHIAMNKLPRHVKRTFYCEECDRCYSIRYIDRYHRTHKKTYHEVNDILIGVNKQSLWFD